MTNFNYASGFRAPTLPPGVIRPDNIDTGQVADATLKALDAVSKVPDMSLRMVQMADIVSRARTSQLQADYQVRRIQSEERRLAASLAYQDKELAAREVMHNQSMLAASNRALADTKRHELELKKISRAEALQLRQEEKELMTAEFSTLARDAFDSAPSAALGANAFLRAAAFASPVASQFSNLSKDQQTNIRGVIRNAMGRYVGGRRLLDWSNALRGREEADGTLDLLMAQGLTADDAYAIIETSRVWHSNYAGTDMDFQKVMTREEMIDQRNELLDGLNTIASIAKTYEESGMAVPEPMQQQMNLISGLITSEVLGGQVRHLLPGQTAPSTPGVAAPIPGMSHLTMSGSVSPVTGVPGAYNPNLAVGDAQAVEVDRAERIPILQGAIAELDAKLGGIPVSQLRGMRSAGPGARPDTSFLTASVTRRMREVPNWSALADQRARYQAELDALDAPNRKAKKCQELQDRISLWQAQADSTGVSDLKRQEARDMVLELKEQLRQIRP